MGVRYYLATSAQATTAARAHPDLTELATSGPWVIFEVADSELVEPLENEPAVLDGQSNNQHEWICAVARRERQVRRTGGHLVPRPRHRRTCSSPPPAPTSGSASTCDDPDPEVRPVPQAEVSNLEVDTDRITFDVDQRGHPGAREGVVLPELAGGRRRRARTAWRRT